jgi:hypothetical protein
MKLKSFGCSLIFGSELADESYPVASNLTWPALLAQSLDLEYECHAQPGCGNLQILERVLDQSVAQESDLFVIGWTWIDRFDYCDISQDQSANVWRTVIPSNSDKLSEFYYRNLSSEFRDKLTTLIYIKTAMDILEQRSIRYVMTYMDPWLFERRWHVTPGVLDLQDQIQPKLVTFEGLNFLDWSRKKGFAETKLWHPLEDAHRSAFELIKSYNF